MPEYPKPKFPDPKYMSRAVGSLIREVDDFIYDPVCDQKKATAGLRFIKGKLTLVVGKAYCEASDQVKAEILQHHCAHLFLGHIDRRESRQEQCWDQVTDATLHFNKACDYKLIDKEVRKIEGFEEHESCTFDHLVDSQGRPVPPMSPEMAYELIMKDSGNQGNGDQRGQGKGQGQPQGGGQGDGENDPNDDGEGQGQGNPNPNADAPSGCGMSSVSSDDGTKASEQKWAKVAIKMQTQDRDFAKNMMAISGRSAGNEMGMGRLAPELKQAPKWIRQVITYLVQSRARTERLRSYRRENRAFEMLPGWPRGYGKRGLFLVDASGSISEEMISQFFSAIVNTPELKDSQVVVFDTTESEYIPVTNRTRILEAIKQRGGGTLIAKAGAKRLPDVPAVWLTDAYSGDGFPPKHSSAEVWVVWGDAQNPPHGITIRANNNAE